MHTFKNASVGFGLALLCFVVFMFLTRVLLDRFALGNYDDLVYAATIIPVLAILSWKRLWVSAGVFAFFALCLSIPGLLIIASLLGCATGQCPIF
jgi:hypothetical protein